MVKISCPLIHKPTVVKSNGKWLNNTNNSIRNENNDHARRPFRYLLIATAVWVTISPGGLPPRPSPPPRRKNFLAPPLLGWLRSQPRVNPRGRSFTRAAAKCHFYGYVQNNKPTATSPPQHHMCIMAAGGSGSDGLLSNHRGARTKWHKPRASACVSACVCASACVRACSGWRCTWLEELDDSSTDGMLTCGPVFFFFFFSLSPCSCITYSFAL